jgi:hypothetical protein
MANLFRLQLLRAAVARQPLITNKHYGRIDGQGECCVLGAGARDATLRALGLAIEPPPWCYWEKDRARAWLEAASQAAGFDADSERFSCHFFGLDYVTESVQFEWRDKQEALQWIDTLIARYDTRPNIPRSHALVPRQRELAL